MPEQTDKRTAILNSTLKLIVERGLEATPMSLIAQQAGVGMGTIYNYFPSKEDLVNVLYRELKLKVHEAMLKGYSREATIRERFFRIWRNVFGHYLRHPDEFLFMEQYSYSPTITPENKAFSQQLWEETFWLFEEARRQQIFKDLPGDLLMLIAGAPVFNLVKEHAAGTIRLDDDLMEAAITACWDAIKR
jgi:AcrR family transcriptional regulator